MHIVLLKKAVQGAATFLPMLCQAFTENIFNFSPETLNSSSNSYMPRTHGYSIKGKRCYGVHDWQAKGRKNAIGAIIEFTFLTLDLFDSNINSDIFYAWLTQELLPKAPTNSVIVMDNASFHKREDMMKAIRNHGSIVVFLSAYSPDLNPIEKKWAQAKAIRRQYRCSVYELFSEHIKHEIL